MISSHLCKVLIVSGLGTGKTNTLLNLINKESGMDEI